VQITVDKFSKYEIVAQILAVSSPDRSQVVGQGADSSSELLLHRNLVPESLFSPINQEDIATASGSF